MSRVWIALLLVGCSSDPGGIPQSWHVSGGFLRDAQGRAVILRGVNLSGAQKSAPYIDDKQPADWQRIRNDWGMNAVRFVMTWAAVEPDEGRYDDAYLDKVAERMRWAQSYGLVVVIDMHEDIFGEGFGFDGAPRWACDEARYAAFVPTTPWFANAVDRNVMACVDDFYTRADRQQHFVAAWRHVAERLAAEPAVIGFDVLNEPLWGSYSILTFEHDRLAPLYHRVVTSVRTAAPTWVAFLEPAASRNAGVGTSLGAFPFANVMYSPHSYDSAAEGGGGFDPSHRQQILDNVANLAAEAKMLHAGLWIGEYGGVASAPGIVEYMTAQYDAAGQVAGSTMYWSYDASNGYGLLNPDGSEKTVLLGTLVRPYPERVAGNPISYAFDAATATFQFEYEPTLALPTEIVVPQRVYPNGYRVDCGDCVYEKRPGELVITKAGSGVVVVHP
jgi:endoglycosylceramidase